MTLRRVEFFFVSKDSSRPQKNIKMFGPNCDSIPVDNFRDQELILSVRGKWYLSKILYE